MRKITIPAFFIYLFSMQVLHAQEKFTEVKIPGLDVSVSRGIMAVQQDHAGYIWILTRSRGLYRYDGSDYIAYIHSEKDSASVTNASLETMSIDSDDVIWIGTLGGGLDKFDPVTGKFTHFKHRSNNPESLAHDTVAAVLADHENNIWIGTYGGLDLYDRKTGKFIHHASNKNDATSISSNHVRAIYEDRKETLWIGCGTPFPGDDASPEEGGLNRFDKVTGKFTRYMHDPGKPGSISNNKVRAILEDSKGTFWVGTAGDGLQTLNRNTGIFTHYYYDSTHPENLSRGPLLHALNYDHITFINEDIKGHIWIGTFFEGIVEYDPQTKKIAHYGFSFQMKDPNDQNSVRLISADTAAGYKTNQAWCAYAAKDGLLWITTLNGTIHQVDVSNKVTLPFTDQHNTIGGNNFYEENDSTLWLATLGLIKRNTRTGKEKIYLHDEHNRNSQLNNVSSIAKDDSGYLWLGTLGGLDRFDPAKETFVHYNVPDTSGSNKNNNINYLLIDHNKNLWIGTFSQGLVKMNLQTGSLTYFRHNAEDSNTLRNNQVLGIAEDKTSIWAATIDGLDRIDKRNSAIKHYLSNANVKSVFIDATGIVWAGTTEGLYYFDATSNTLMAFHNINVKIDNVLGISGDNENDLWICAVQVIYKIDPKRENVAIYGAANSVHPNTFLFCNNISTKEGEVLLGDQLGYYHFFPKDVAFDPSSPYINISSFQVGGKEVVPGLNSILQNPVNKTNVIELAHDQNSFALGFSAIHFRTQGDVKYLYQMENYDNTWHDAGADSHAYFFSIPPGKYVFKVRAVNSDGGWAEKDLSVIILPPWWSTWWFRVLSVIALVVVIYAIVIERSRKLKAENIRLEEKVNERTQQLQQSIHELKSTQAQLIQSEKMASLGELTAGIAHEIQNPLNFVNNFSEVNNELVDELQNELKAGNTEEAFRIANDIKENEQKINHHGKRADSIVKGMLQHSRTNTGQKELTDINALADEYLRLSYHGLRAKDKSFNTEIKTDFDESIKKVNAIPQDIGRVLLNLFNNAFYAVNEKKKITSVEYRPTVIVATKKVGDKISISVKDNGTGIPQKVADKIFQPFFTTKPTGQGTGLGLSLSYDIIKAHGGEIKVDTKEGEGTEFAIQLPLSNLKI